MSGALRDWLLGLLAAAMLGVICAGLAGEDRRAMRLTVGLVLLLALCGPVTGIDLAWVSQLLAQSRMEARMAETEIEVRNRALLAQIISEQTEAYILDKASALGMTLQVTVETAQGETYPYPAAVTLTGHTTTAQRQTLNAWIAEQLAIAEENLTWKETEP